MDALTPDCYMLPGTLVWRCELKESKHKATFQFFSKVISHSNSARTSTHKTDSLSIGYRLWLIRVQNEIPTRWYTYMQQKKIKAWGGWQHSLDRHRCECRLKNKVRQYCFDVPHKTLQPQYIKLQHNNLLLLPICWMYCT